MDMQCHEKHSDPMHQMLLYIWLGMDQELAMGFVNVIIIGDFCESSCSTVAGENST